MQNCDRTHQTSYARVVARGALLAIAAIAISTVFATPGRAQFYHYPLHVGVRCQDEGDVRHRQRRPNLPSCLSLLTAWG